MSKKWYAIKTNANGHSGYGDIKNHIELTTHSDDKLELKPNTQYVIPTPIEIPVGYELVDVETDEPNVDIKYYSSSRKCWDYRSVPSHPLTDDELYIKPIPTYVRCDCNMEKILKSIDELRKKVDWLMTN